MKNNTIIVPGSLKQAWSCHTWEELFYLRKSGQEAPLIFAVDVAFLVCSFYGCDMVSLRSHEWAKLSENVGSQGLVEDVVSSPVQRIGEDRKLVLTGGPKGVVWPKSVMLGGVPECHRVWWVS